MQSIVKYEPAFSLLQVNLAPGESITAEAGAMVARSSNLQMEVKLNSDPSAGFGAKLCIHPRQVPLVNAAFAPTAAGSLMV